MEGDVAGVMERPRSGDGEVGGASRPAPDDESGTRTETEKWWVTLIVHKETTA